MKHLPGKMRFLAIKLSALRSELKISQEILASASREADEMFKKKYFPEVQREQPDLEGPPEIHTNSDDNPQPPPGEIQPDDPHLPGEEDDVRPASKQNVAPEIKKLFRKISTKIHPDKLEGLPNGFEKERKLKLYAEARSAYEAGDILILANVCLELGMPIPDISPEKLKETEVKISTIKNELNHIESTIVWQWFFCSNPKEKEEILEKLFKIMYEISEN